MIITKEFSQGIKVHGIRTGEIAVKREHFNYSGRGMLRFYNILFEKNWVSFMPIWNWLIETPQGNYMIDTGLTTGFYQHDYFKGKIENYVNRKIMKVKTVEELRIDNQLHQIGLNADKIDNIILTHLHLDHVDGAKYFPKAEFLVSKTDWNKPLGAPVTTFPKWLKPLTIDYKTTDLPFDGVFNIGQNLKIVPTPGHTNGHQSVLLEVDGYTIMFAGDITFNQQQLIDHKVGGINMNIKQTKNTISKVQTLGKQTPLIYLPSHDREAGDRLLNLQTLNKNQDLVGV